jgi:hypothetical protein
LPSVASDTYLQKTSAVPYKVSSDFGKVDDKRQRISGMDCAMAGAAIAPAPTLAPAAARN